MNAIWKRWRRKTLHFVNCRRQKYFVFSSLYLEVFATVQSSSTTSVSSGLVHGLVGQVAAAKRGMQRPHAPTELNSWRNTNISIHHLCDAKRHLSRSLPLLIAVRRSNFWRSQKVIDYNLKIILKKKVALCSNGEFGEFINCSTVWLVKSLFNRTTGKIKIKTT